MKYFYVFLHPETVSWYNPITGEDEKAPFDCDVEPIDTVSYVDSSTADEVRESLINHDGYPSDITVKEAE